MAQFLVMLTEFNMVNFMPSFLSPVPRPHVSRGAARERDRLVDVRCKNIVLQRPKQRSQRYDFYTRLCRPG